MARSRSTNDDGEYIEATGGGAIPDVTLPPIVNEAPVVADATAKTKTPDPGAVASVRYFEVERGGYILDRGYRTLLREGKIVDTLNYDPKRLASQGIKLREVGPDARAAAPGSTFDL